MFFHCSIYYREWQTILKINQASPHPENCKKPMKTDNNNQFCILGWVCFPRSHVNGFTSWPMGTLVTKKTTHFDDVSTYVYYDRREKESCVVWRFWTVSWAVTEEYSVNGFIFGSITLWQHYGWRPGCPHNFENPDNRRKWSWQVEVNFDRNSHPFRLSYCDFCVLL